MEAGDRLIVTTCPSPDNHSSHRPAAHERRIFAAVSLRGTGGGEWSGAASHLRDRCLKHACIFATTASQVPVVAVHAAERAKMNYVFVGPNERMPGRSSAGRVVACQQASYYQPCFTIPFRTTLAGPAAKSRRHWRRCSWPCQRQRKRSSANCCAALRWSVSRPKRNGNGLVSRGRILRKGSTSLRRCQCLLDVRSRESAAGKNPALGSRAECPLGATRIRHPAAVRRRWLAPGDPESEI